MKFKGHNSRALNVKIKYFIGPLAHPVERSAEQEDEGVADNGQVVGGSNVVVKNLDHKHKALGPRP